MCVHGVFVKVSHKAYVKLYYNSIAASSVSHFPGPAITKEEFQLSKSELQSFNFGSLVVNEDYLPLYGDVTKIDDATCAKLVHESFIIPTTSIPELYYNESFKIQLKYHLEHKGYSVSSQQTGILPYNSYYKSVVDLLITKTESSTSPFSSFLAVNTTPITPPSEEEEEEDIPTDVTDTTTEVIDIPGNVDPKSMKILLSELKKTQNIKAGRAQMYAEAFNVGVTKFVDMYPWQ